MASDSCAIGVDLGGTKIVVALVDASGRVLGLLRYPTDVKGGPEAVAEQIVSAVRELRKGADSEPWGVGVGLAGQIESETGLVHFAPNLGWHNVPFQFELKQAIGLPVAITNDVRAATWGEWLHGAGRGCDELLCVFVGTGIGGGIVTKGHIVSGCGNAAGEVGHLILDLNGPVCHCGQRGCFEALAGGWAIAQRAQEVVHARPQAGAGLLGMAGGQREKISAKTVAEAFEAGDELARQLLEEVTEALVAGTVSLVNILNPCRLILGGGVIQGMPWLVDRVERGIRQKALGAATKSLEVILSKLGSDAGVTGAAALAMQVFSR